MKIDTLVENFMSCFHPANVFQAIVSVQIPRPVMALSFTILNLVRSYDHVYILRRVQELVEIPRYKTAL